MDAVCFDVDSTVIQQEAIDELAKFTGKFPEVCEITDKAMSGNLPFNEALRTRLNIIKPSIEQIRDFNHLRVLRLTPNIKNFMDALRQKNIDIFLISGGFRCFIEPIASLLNIPFKNVFANRLLFNFDGSYATFDQTLPTARNGGKAKVIEKLKQDNYNYRNVIMVGDGITDLEACPPADYFIGFGGNIIRKEVKDRSLLYFYDFDDLRQIFLDYNQSSRS